MGLFYVHQRRSKNKKLPETESLKKARLEHRKFLISKGVNPDKKINPKEFSAVANWWETTSVQKPAVLAHSVEQLICNQQVVCSNRTRGTTTLADDWRLREGKKFTIAPAYNKGGYQVISPNNIKDIGK